MGSEKGKTKQIEKLRREYEGKGLRMDQMETDPIDQFSIWFEEALESDNPDANAMTLATAADGLPSARVVLLKGVDSDGFRFYTNYNSRKGEELDENPNAALCFYWPELMRQVRVEGSVSKVEREMSEAYFNVRPRDSQLGAWASQQSSRIENRRDLEERFDQVREQFAGEEVPLPEFWGGYLLTPRSIEFWQGRPSRLHDRILYQADSDGWSRTRLAP